MDTSGSSGIAFGDILLICGGEPATTDCYKLEVVQRSSQNTSNTEWTKTDSLLRDRSYSAITFSPVGLWISGGYDSILQV